MARLEETRIFLSLVVYNNFKLYQIDVEFIFFDWKLEDDIYIKHHDGFNLGYDPKIVLKLKKALYRLK